MMTASTYGMENLIEAPVRWVSGGVGLCDWVLRRNRSGICVITFWNEIFRDP